LAGSIAAARPAAPAAAEPLTSTATGREDVAVTVYNDNLGLVHETRTVVLPEGATELRFMDVASEIRPETVSVTSDGVSILEQNYEYDLLNPDKVLEKYVGRQVTVFVKNEATGDERPVRATLLSVAGGEIFQIGDDISLGLPGRVVVPQLPESLIARPTLVWNLTSKTAGPRKLAVSYLTRAMSWHADYVAALAADEKSIDLTGWVTIDNQSGASYEDAKLKLVAGDVHVIQPEPRQMRARTMDYALAMAEPAFTRRELFEYHLYELDRPSTVKHNQSKQIELLVAPAVPTTKRYVAETQFNPYGQDRPSDAAPAKADVKLEFANTTASHLGRPLPKGIVRVYKRDKDGAQVFAGEDAIEHTADGETVRLTMGQAFDVLYERKVTSFREISKREVEAGVEIVVRNRKDEPVRVTVVERFPQEKTLVRSSIDARQPDAFTLEFDVDVKAKDETTLTFLVQAKR